MLHSWSSRCTSAVRFAVTTESPQEGWSVGKSPLPYLHVPAPMRVFLGQASTWGRQSMSQQQQQPPPQPTKQQHLHGQRRAASATTTVAGSAGGEATVFAFDFDGEPCRRSDGRGVSFFQLAQNLSVDLLQTRRTTGTVYCDIAGLSCSAGKRCCAVMVVPCTVGAWTDEEWKSTEKKHAISPDEPRVR